MTIPKKVTFIEKIAKSKLGLNGLQKVVYSDKARSENVNIENKEYNFEDIGRKMLEAIDGNYIQKKYSIKPSKEFGEKLHSERIEWLKKQKENQ